jgi:basic membrane lipoprotein Med (substrate-binding protein (PBP1-ABC) superfamily)
VTTAIVRFDVNIDMAIGLVVSKKIEPKNYLLGFNENGIDLAPFRKFDDKIAAADKAKIQQLVADIKAGKVADLPKIQ